jgi:hypothetical protein
MPRPKSCPPESNDGSTISSVIRFMMIAISVDFLDYYSLTSKSEAPMTNLSDPDFYQRREQEERKLAEQAHDPAIAAIHLDLAKAYADKAAAAVETASPPRLRLRPTFQQTVPRDND